jgi:hypothetical protein
MTDERYPIGKFQAPASIDAAMRAAWIDDIAILPSDLLTQAGGLTCDQVDTPYREGGWTVRQLIHHVADSHMNSYIRCKLAITEQAPAIATYDEKLWAKTPDNKLPIEVSLSLLEALHRRWVALWKNLASNDWERTYRHPERGLTTLEHTLGLYAWHGRHHVAHIAGLRQRKHWS